MEFSYNFNPKKSLVFKAVKAERLFLINYTFFINRLLILISLFFLLFSFIHNSFYLFLGISSLFFSFFLIFLQINLFFQKKLKKIKPKVKLSEVILNPLKYNLADFFSFDSAKVINKVLKEREEVNSFILFKSLLSESKKINYVFLKLGFKSFSEKSEFSSKENFKDVIVRSLLRAVKERHDNIELEDILFTVLDVEPFLKEILFKNNIDVQDIKTLYDWYNKITKEINDNRKFWKKKNLIKRGSLFKSWVSGYTLTLDKYSIDWTEKFRKNNFPDFIGHKREIGLIEVILARREINNVLIVGENGVGRKNIIYEIARKSFYGESFPEVNNKRIVELDIPFLLAQTKNNEEAENLLDVIFKETTTSGNVILVINEFHNFISTEHELGKLDISGILSSYLHFPEFQIIGITDHAGFRENIEKKYSVASYMGKVEVSELTEKETLELIQRISLDFERKHKKIISYSSLKSIISYSTKYLTESYFPKKAIEVLDESINHLIQSGEKILLPKNISETISRITNMPIGDLNEKEKDLLLNLENLIHQRIIGQKDAVKEISSGLRRSRSEISERKRPMGSFLFLGPTGVGKTETAKALSHFYFGSEDKMIRVDMSEFQNLSDIERLIGSSKSDGFLTSKIKENPFSLILLDELEKAHPDILNLFLQVLDDGYLNDGYQRKINFKNSIIIATSNAGADFILNEIHKKTEWDNVKRDLLNKIFNDNIFRPEFINRFDSVIVFKPLTKLELMKIIDLILNDIIFNLKKKGIQFYLDDKKKLLLVEMGYNPNFGARELKRKVQEKIENPLSSAILSGKINRGDKVTININSSEVEKIE